jgi:hypothetical protein
VSRPPVRSAASWTVFKVNPIKLALILISFSLLIACGEPKLTAHEKQVARAEQAIAEVEPIAKLILNCYAQRDAAELHQYMSRMLKSEVSLKGYQDVIDANPDRWRNFGEHTDIKQIRHISPHTFVFLDTGSNDEIWAFVHEDDSWKLRASSDNLPQLLELLNMKIGKQ